MLAGSVTAAADLLRVTQPTISKLIAQLEINTKLKLFDRVRGRLIPRREAHALMHDVEKVVQAVDEVGRSARNLARGHSGHIRVAAIPSLGMSFFPRAIASFVASRPQVGVTLIVREAGYVNEWVAAQSLDIGFVPEGGSVATGTISTRFRGSSNAVCVLPQNHRLAHKSVIRPADFAEERVISMGREPTFRYLIDRAFVEANIGRKVAIETNNFAAACLLVAEGAGISVVDPFSASTSYDSGGIVLRPFRPEVPFLVNIIRPVNRPIPLLVEDFVSHLSDEAQRMEERLKKVLVARPSSR
ncbi:MAG: hypothetical protein QOD94_2947 [Alphaproteobacteria bacterium]|nr:hypothetical protein [Alphaproteobacteria bacterium]